jgi:hypothetical protein
MKPRIALLAIAVLAVAGFAVGGVFYLRHHPGGSTSTAGGTHPSATARGDARSTDQHAEDAFIGATAVHLCNVQTTVYDDQKTLAAAYNAVPSYDGLSAEQVKRFQRRLANDRALSARLATQLATSCRPKAAP